MFPLSPFFRFTAALCFNAFTAICSLRDKLYFGFCVVTSHKIRFIGFYFLVSKDLANV